MAEAPAPASTNEKLPAKMTLTGVGGPAAAAKSDDGKGTLGKAALFSSTATVGGEVRRGCPERASGEAPPWKGFTLSYGELESHYCLVRCCAAVSAFAGTSVALEAGELSFLKGRPNGEPGWQPA